jgi:hypothetical protein
MPLQKLQFRPGVNREGTTLANEGGWFESDKVRFRSGYPEKIGGWILDTGVSTEILQPPSGSFWGVCRSMWNWLNLSAYNLLALGTNFKYYIQNGVDGNLYDITPLRNPSGTVLLQTHLQRLFTPRRPLDTSPLSAMCPGTALKLATLSQFPAWQVTSTEFRWLL